MQLELPKNKEDFASFRHVAAVAFSLYNVHLRVNKKEMDRLMDMVDVHYESIRVDYDYSENHKGDFYWMRIIVDDSVPDGVAYLGLNSMAEVSYEDT